MYKIYIVRNTVNGKIYVGQTMHSVSHRWREHRNAAVKDKRVENIIFYRAIRKHGPDAFVANEIDSVEIKEWANLLEMAYIHLYQATNPLLGYNSTYGGEGATHTPESKMRQSESAKKRGQWYLKAGVPHPRVGMKHSPEAIEKMKGPRKPPKPPKQPKKIGSPKGWKHTPEAIAKIAAASRRPMSEAAKIKLSESRKGAGNPMFGKKGHYYTHVTVEQVVALRNQGLDIKAVARQLNVSRNVVYNRLGVSWN